MYKVRSWPQSQHLGASRGIFAAASCSRAMPAIEKSPAFILVVYTDQVTTVCVSSLRVSTWPVDVVCRRAAVVTVVR